MIKRLTTWIAPAGSRNSTSNRTIPELTVMVEITFAFGFTMQRLCNLCCHDAGKHFQRAGSEGFLFWTGYLAYRLCDSASDKIRQGNLWLWLRNDHSRDHQPSSDTDADSDEWLSSNIFAPIQLIV